VAFDETNLFFLKAVKAQVSYGAICKKNVEHLAAVYLATYTEAKPGVDRLGLRTVIL